MRKLPNPNTCKESIDMLSGSREQSEPIRGETIEDGNKIRHLMDENEILREIARALRTMNTAHRLGHLSKKAEKALDTLDKYDLDAILEEGR